MADAFVFILNSEEKIEPKRAQLKPVDNAPPERIYVAGVDYEATEKELEEYFGKWGKVKDVLIMCDRLTKKPRGFAFISFENPKSAQALLNATEELKFKGREVNFVVLMVSWKLNVLCQDPDNLHPLALEV